jgi:hypothetical protein
MKLPNRESTVIPHSKLTDYLLSQNHAIGKSKSKFFRQFGFDETNIDEFERGLKEIAQENDFIEQISVPHGEKYVINGILKTPAGRPIAVTTIWIIEKGEITPRFVTAYPA